MSKKGVGIKNRYSFLYRNGLSLFFVTIMILTLGGQAYTGWKEHNKDLEEEHVPPIAFAEYFNTGHFYQATFENWESEFLQMAMYVILTIHLRQLGSSESKKLGVSEEVDRKPKPHPNAPWPVKKGGWILKIYSQSLSLAFFLLFIISFWLHVEGSMKDYNEEQRLKNQPEESFTEYLTNTRLWFESFQNWQSEFLSVASIVFLSIYLRQQGSPESKPVDAPNFETGSG